MSTVKTTVRLPEKLHEALRYIAFKKHTALNQVVVDTLRAAISEELQQRKVDTKKIESEIEFFKTVASQGKQLDAVQAVKSERLRDDTPRD